MRVETCDKRVRKQSRLFYGYWILLVGFICQVIVNGLGVYAFSLYVLPLHAEFGWNRATIMAGYTMMQLTTGLASPFIGRIAYRLGAKWVIAAGGLLMGIGFFLLSLGYAFWQFYLLYAIVGFGTGAAGVVPTSMVISNWFKRGRGFAIGILGTGIGFGGFIMPVLLGTYIIPSLGWRMGYVVSGIISAGVLIPLSLQMIKSHPHDIGLLPDNDKTGEDDHDQAKNPSQQGFKLNEAFKTQAFWLLAVAFISFEIANGHTFQNEVPHLQDVGFSSVIAASVLSVVGIASAIGKFIFGWFCDFIPPKYILIIGSILQAGATLILMTVTPNSPMFMLWLYAAMFGLGMGSWFPAISLNTSATFGLVSYGDIFGIYTMLFMVTSAISPWIGGYIFDTTGSYNQAFLACLIFYALTVPCMLMVRRPKPEKK